MLSLLRVLLGAVLSSLKTRHQLALENLASRQQLGVLRRSVKRPRLSSSDRVFWVLLRRCWASWDHVLAVVQPATVIRSPPTNSLGDGCWEAKGFDWPPASQSLAAAMVPWSAGKRPRRDPRVSSAHQPQEPVVAVVAVVLCEGAVGGFAQIHGHCQRQLGVLPTELGLEPGASAHRAAWRRAGGSRTGALSLAGRGRTPRRAPAHRLRELARVCRACRGAQWAAATIRIESLRSVAPTTERPTPDNCASTARPAVVFRFVTPMAPPTGIVSAHPPSMSPSKPSQL